MLPSFFVESLIYDLRNKAFLEGSNSLNVTYFRLLFLEVLAKDGGLEGRSH